MRINILIGGSAGQGPNFLAQLTGEVLVSKGYYVFYSRDYQSLIRGGHNFNVLTFSNQPVHSNDSKIDIIVALDKETEDIHKKNLKKSGIIIKDSRNNAYFAGRLFKILNLDFKTLESEFRKFSDFEDNMKNAEQGYEEENRKINLPEFSREKQKIYFMNGSQAVAAGAINSQINVYYAYPMTPATPLMNELAQKQIENNFIVLELENEIACINAAIGSAITGEKSMAGTSGGGFDLMTEAISMAAQAEIPLVIYLAQRPGPGTGMPTYTSQGDLNMALNCGHGESQRIVLAPGDTTESIEKTTEAFYFSQKFKIPCIILSDKHLAESFYSTDEDAKITDSEKTTQLEKYNSYEHTKEGFLAEDIETIKKNFERRMKKAKNIEKESEKFETYKIHGKGKSENVILAWGSTKGAIVDAIKGLDCKFLQILYLEPFSSEKIKKELEKAENIIVIENNSTSQLSKLIAQKTGIFIEDKNKILRYDGRPFLADELNKEIAKRLR